MAVISANGANVGANDRQSIGAHTAIGANEKL